MEKSPHGQRFAAHLRAVNEFSPASKPGYHGSKRNELRYVFLLFVTAMPRDEFPAFAGPDENVGITTLIHLNFAVLVLVRV